ncbi:MAG TPA: hypothetical protein VJH06_00925 [Candidatus Paceibacterota bacterium]
MNKITKYGGLLLIIILVVSLYYNFKTSNSPAQISKTKEVSFEQKQECAIYKKQIEDKFEKNNNGEIAVEYYYFDRIFYSPKEDSCLYVYSGQFGLKANERYRMLYLADALSGDILYQKTVVREGKVLFEEENDFNVNARSYETQ